MSAIQIHLNWFKTINNSHLASWTWSLHVLLQLQGINNWAHAAVATPCSHYIILYSYFIKYLHFNHLRCDTFANSNIDFDPPQVSPAFLSWAYLSPHWVLRGLPREAERSSFNVIAYCHRKMQCQRPTKSAPFKPIVLPNVYAVPVVLFKCKIYTWLSRFPFTDILNSKLGSLIGLKSSIKDAFHSWWS